MPYKMLYLARRAATVSWEDWPRTWKSHAIFASQFPAMSGTIDWMRYTTRVDDPSLGMYQALIEARLGVIRERLFEDAADEVRLGINALSAPIFRDDNEFIGIIGIIGTSVEIGTPPSLPLIATLHHVAGALSAELNCRIYSERGLIK